MRFSLLGETLIESEGGTVTIAAPKQRALLALLLLQRGAPATVDLLASELWGERLPATPVKTVQVYIAQLRKALGDGVVLTSGRSYLVDLDSNTLDLVEFDRLAAEGLRLLAGCEPEAAAATLDEALSLWRGPPLADFAYEDFAQAETARVRELRLAALEARNDANLQLGRHLEILGDLETLVRAEPERERLVGQLMVALYRSGRQAAALETYQQAREALTDRLGIEPGRPLRDLERAILNQDPSLDVVPRSSRQTGVAHASAGAFVGREPELELLLEGLDEALSGRGRLFLLVGEPGIGKSRLAEELVVRARARGTEILVGRCREAGGAPAFWPWVQALRGYTRTLDPATLRSQLGAGAPDIAHLLPELRELFPDLPEPPAPESEGARFRLFEAVAAFLGNVAADRPTLLVLDDLHAADEPSLLLLSFLAREVGSRRLLLLGALRDVDPTPDRPLNALLADAARDPACRSVALTGLSEDAVAEYVDLTAGAIASPEVVRALHEETEGNPLFVTEMVRLLAVEGAGDGPSGTRAAIPQGVRAVIERRVGHLSGACRQLLVLASVLGREFALPALARIAAASPDDVLETLDEAMAARIVVEVPDDRGRLRFAHVLIRDTLYDGLTPARRIKLHRLAAAGLEELEGTSSGPYLTELAAHWIAGRKHAKGLDYATRAADRAAALLAHEEAARLYELGIGLIEADGVGGESERCELLLRLGDVQARAGDVPSAKQTFLRAAEVARASARPQQLARAALGYGGRFVWSRPWGDDSLVPLLEEALAALPGEDSELRIRLAARLAGGALRDTLPVGPRVAMAQQALDIARRLGDPATLAYALSARHCANWGADALAERIAIAQELVEVAEAAGDLERAYEGHDFLCLARWEAGEIDATREEEAIKFRLARELGQPAQLWDSTVNRAQRALFEGRFADAEADIHQAFELGRSAQSANAQVGFDLQIYALHRELGRLDESLETIERAVGSLPTYPVWEYARVDALVQLGRYDQARMAFDDLAEGGFVVRLEMQWLCSLDLLTDVCRCLSDADRAATLYSLLAPYGQRNVLTTPEFCRGSASRGLALLASTMANWSMATRHFEDALEHNARMGAHPWLAHTQDDYGRMLLERDGPGDVEQARELLDRAIETYRRLGMTGFEARAVGTREASDV